VKLPRKDYSSSFASPSTSSGQAQYKHFDYCSVQAPQTVIFSSLSFWSGTSVSK